MTSPLPETPGIGGPGSGRGLRAIISGAALRANATLVAAQGPWALPHDAWGHGAEAVLAALGTDPAARDAGPPQDESALTTLFGLSGSATPAMRLLGTVLSVKPLLAGEGVSYGYTHRAAQDTRVALVTGGYAQGIVRALGNRAEVVIDAVRRPIVGRVAMDVCVVDVGDARVERGDDVVFFGDPAHDDPSVQEWAAATGYSVPEIVTIVGQRATREYTR